MRTNNFNSKNISKKQSELEYQREYLEDLVKMHPEESKYQEDLRKVSHELDNLNSLSTKESNMLQ